MRALLITVAIFSSAVQRLPLTAPVIYLFMGLLLGSFGLKWVKFDPLAHPVLFEHLAEIAVVVSLFTVGLKLRLPMKDRLWRIPCRLAFVSMALMVFLVAVAGVLALGLSWGAAILLGAILAPTDPVLASGVELKHPHDQNRFRFSLTGEAGLNDGTAFPFVMLGLGLLGLHNLGEWGWQWGIGSIYYLMYAVNQGLDPELAQRLMSLTLTVVASSIVVHGITVTPLMSWYKRLRHSD